jgi:type II secretory pathway component PulK
VNTAPAPVLAALADEQDLKEIESLLENRPRWLQERGRFSERGQTDRGCADSKRG